MAVPRTRVRNTVWGTRRAEPYKFNPAKIVLNNKKIRLMNGNLINPRVKNEDAGYGEFNKMILDYKKFIWEDANESWEEKTEVWWRIRDRYSEEQLEPTLRNLSYFELRRLNFIIYVVHDMFKGKNLRYYRIAPSDSGFLEYGAIPPDIKIEYDETYKKVRLIDERKSIAQLGYTHAYQDWISIKKRQTSFLTFEEEFERKLSKGRQYWGEQEEEQEDLFVKDVPAGFDVATGDLICIPVLPDPVRIGLLGDTGTGKTFEGHALFCFYRLQQKWTCGVINDSNWETTTWWKRWRKSDKGMVNLLAKLGLQTKGLPCVYLYPQNKEIQLKPLEDEDENAFRFSMSFEDFIIYNFEHFRKSPEFKLAVRSTRDLQKQLNKLVKVKPGKESKENILTILQENIVQQTKKGTKPKDSIIDAIMSVIEKAFEENILDVSSGIPSKWEAIYGLNIMKERITDHPFIICLFCNLCPILMTQQLEDREYGSQYFAFILNRLYHLKFHQPDFIDRMILLYCPEITEVAPDDKHNPTTKVISKISGKGRIRGISLMWDTNYPQMVYKRLFKNTNYFLIFNSSPDDAKIICERFGETDKKLINQIVTLPKHQFILFTKDYVVRYKKNGKTEKEQRAWIRCSSIAPLSMHMKPQGAEA